MAAEQTHRANITSDEPFEMTVQVGGGWWFKVFHSLVDSGWWADMSPAAAKVYLVLAKHANNERLCWPGMTLITKESGIKQSAVYAALNQLEAFKLIERRVRGYGTKKTVYEIKDVKSRPAGTFQCDGGVHQNGHSGRLSIPVETVSKPVESRLLEGIRSTSNRELKSAEGRVGREEIEQWAKDLGDDEAAALKQSLLEAMTPIQRNVFAKSSIRSSYPLAAIAHDFLQKGHL